MKTLKIFNQTIAAIAITLLSVVTFAQDNENAENIFGANSLTTSNTFAFIDENYIDDIPFNTEEIALVTELAAFESDEATIDDIPFNTEEIVFNIELAAFVSDEETIDDIPFNTELIVLNIQLAAFESDEDTIDDIPFNTERVVAAYHYNMAVNHTFEFSMEDYINDIPYDTYCVLNQEDGTICEINITE